MNPEPPDDDKCQVSTCQQTHFTYCPHCKLFVCIEHLNEHYSTYKQEYQVLLNDGKQQQVLNKQFIDEIEHEKKQWTQFFNDQIEYYQLNDRFFHEKTIQVTIRPQDCADLRTQILQSSERRSKLKKILQQIESVINEYNEQHRNHGIPEEASSNPLIRVKSEEFTPKSKLNKSSPLAQFSIDYEEIDEDNNEGETGRQQPSSSRQNNHVSQTSNNQTKRSTLTNGKTSTATRNSQKPTVTTNNKDIPDESDQSDEDLDEEDESDNDHPASDPDFSGTRRTNTTHVRRKRDPATSRPAVNHYQVSICPLANKLYGIDLNKHPLRHVPCTRSNISSIYLFTHLRVFHCLSSKASLRLVRHIICNGSERDCDLFSQWNDSLVNILPKSYRGRCPLTKLGVFGLTKFHDIRLCQDHQTHDNTGLLNHFVVYHCLSYPWANKLCNVMQGGDQDGSKHVLFKPNEPIKAKKWLTTQGKNILAKRYASVRKRRKRLNNNKHKT